MFFAGKMVSRGLEKIEMPVKGFAIKKLNLYLSMGERKICDR